MFTQIHYPRQISKEMLDFYLERGWFRMGQMIFTCMFLCFKGDLYTAVWVRLALENYRFRKGQRKLMSRNAREFDIIIRRAIFDEEKEALYQKHKARFEGYIAASLIESLFGESDRDIYETWECCIYKDGRLVGVSFFDNGDMTTASIMGLFDPDYQQYSLGYYSMLLEVEWAMNQGKLFYYPGYVVPKYGRFDYKLRIGDVEYYDFFDHDWHDYKDLSDTGLLSEILKDKLTSLQAALEQNEIYSQRVLYPLYDRELVGVTESFVKYPIFLSCYHHKLNHRFLVIEYDLHDHVFRLSVARRYEDSLSYLAYVIFEGHDEKTSFLEFLVVEEVVLETISVEQLVEAIHDNSNVIRGHDDALKNG